MVAQNDDSLAVAMEAVVMALNLDSVHCCMECQMLGHDRYCSADGLMMVAVVVVVVMVVVVDGQMWVVHALYWDSEHHL